MLIAAFSRFYQVDWRARLSPLSARHPLLIKVWPIGAKAQVCVCLLLLDGACYSQRQLMDHVGIRWSRIAASIILRFVPMSLMSE
ncbi:hypothetical protein [Halochromatium sp.]